MNRCFIGYVVQAVVVNFLPLLFVTLEKDYGITVSQISLLITVNFVIQLSVDLLSAAVIDRIGYRVAMNIAHILAATGLVLLAFLPDIMDPFVGILIPVAVYAMGGGLLEVIISPMVEACPTENKEKTMSLLHSFYSWGQVGVVLLSTAFFAVFGVKNWKILVLIWAAVPVGNILFFASAPVFSLPGQASGENKTSDSGGRVGLKALFLNGLFWVMMDYDDMCRGGRAGGQSVGVGLCRTGPRSQQNGRRFGRTYVLCRLYGRFEAVLR